MDTDDALDASLARLADGDLAARDRIIELCSERLRSLAHRMLRRYPTVRRYDDTDDVFQNAAMRLHRALGQMATDRETPRSLMALAATQIHRELIDLARRNAGPQSYAANHGTNVARGDDTERYFVEEAAGGEEPLDRWEQFHGAVEGLAADQREVFQMVWYLGADQRTIAAVMGCSERTVKSHWRQAREAVKTALDGERPR
jgi:RNA polymerase sigma-70 factor (ECF subfamily)